MAKFCTWKCSQYANVTQRSEYARKYFDRALNISRVLNMPGFWICLGSRYVRFRHGSKYATIIWLHKSIIIIIIIIIIVTNIIMLEFLSAWFTHPGALLPFHITESEHKETKASKLLMDFSFWLQWRQSFRSI